MITQRYFERDGDSILFRIAVNEASVLDVLMTDSDVESCLQLLHASADLPSQTIRMGSFGPFNVSLTVWRNEATILIEGPELDHRFCGEQAAGVYLEREDLAAALTESDQFDSQGRRVLAPS